MTRSIVADYELPHAPRKVWRALSEPALRARWLAPEEAEAQCEVVAAEPPRLLRLRWRMEDEGETRDTLVTLTLSETEEGHTRLHLVHEEVEAQAVVAMTTHRPTAMLLAFEPRRTRRPVARSAPLRMAA
jgi:uncharacterized protein YndB with AHSA1/START domain